MQGRHKPSQPMHLQAHLQPRQHGVNGRQLRRRHGRLRLRRAGRRGAGAQQRRAPAALRLGRVPRQQAVDAVGSHAVGAVGGAAGRALAHRRGGAVGCAAAVGDGGGPGATATSGSAAALAPVGQGRDGAVRVLRARSQRGRNTQDWVCVRCCAMLAVLPFVCVTGWCVSVPGAGSSAGHCGPLRAIRARHMTRVQTHTCRKPLDACMARGSVGVRPWHSKDTR